MIPIAAGGFEPPSLAKEASMLPGCTKPLYYPADLFFIVFWFSIQHISSPVFSTKKGAVALLCAQLLLL